MLRSDSQILAALAECTEKKHYSANSQREKRWEILGRKVDKRMKAEFMHERCAMLLVLILWLLVGCGGGETKSDKQVWKFAIEEIQGSVQDAYAQKFKERIAEHSDGRIDVTVYPYGALGTSAQLTELVQSNSIQFAMASPGHLGSVVPEVQIFSLHFVFSDDEEVNHRVLAQSERLRALLGKAYRAKKLHLLSVIQEGWMVWTANKTLRTPADFSGVKMRTMVSPLLLEAYKAYGANPTPLPYSEVYSGLQLNMIDAQVNPVFAIEEMSFYEVQDYMIFPNHLPFVATVVTSPTFFDGLEERDKKLVLAVVGELDEYIFQVQRDFNRERLKKIQQASDIEIIRLFDEERAAFRQASMPVRDKYRELAGASGDALLTTLLSEVERESGSTR